MPARRTGARLRRWEARGQLGQGAVCLAASRSTAGWAGQNPRGCQAGRALCLFQLYERHFARQLRCLQNKLRRSCASRVWRTCIPVHQGPVKVEDQHAAVCSAQPQQLGIGGFCARTRGGARHICRALLLLLSGARMQLQERQAGVARHGRAGRGCQALCAEPPDNGSREGGRGLDQHHAGFLWRLVMGEQTVWAPQPALRVPSTAPTHKAPNCASLLHVEAARQRAGHVGRGGELLQQRRHRLSQHAVVLVAAVLRAGRGRRWLAGGPEGLVP